MKHNLRSSGASPSFGVQQRHPLISHFGFTGGARNSERPRDNEESQKQATIPSWQNGQLGIVHRLCISTISVNC